MTGGMTECAAKMQKAPTFSGRGWTILGVFAWFSSTCSHMGQQSNAAWRFFRLITHKEWPP